MATIRKTNTKAETSVASQPVKAGETTPSNIKPHITFQQAMDVAATKIDALLRGGVDCITYVSAAFLVGYLSRDSDKPKLNVMRDEFALALGKKGLGGTQTKKYLDYAFKLTGMMFKECQYGMETAALIAADTPDKAHDAVKAYLTRKTMNKKTEHGYSLNDATVRLNILGIFLGYENDPNKPDDLMGDQAAQDKRIEASRKGAAARIEKDPAILQKVEAGRLIDTVTKVISFDVLIVKHIERETKVDALRAEMAKVIAAYESRITFLSKDMGNAVKSMTKGQKKRGKVTSETVTKAA